MVFVFPFLTKFQQMGRGFRLGLMKREMKRGMGFGKELGNNGGGPIQSIVPRLSEENLNK